MKDWIVRLTAFQWIVAVLLAFQLGMTTIASVRIVKALDIVSVAATASNSAAYDAVRSLDRINDKLTVTNEKLSDIALNQTGGTRPPPTQVPPARVAPKR